MDINFELILVWAVIISGALYLLDVLLIAKKRGDKKQPLLIEYARSFFPILIIVLVIRSFIVEPFRIPSGSLEPTLQIGDFIVVSKYKYGLRLPVLKTKVVEVSEPKVGDIMVFRWPNDPSIDYIKRVVGLPGDKISYIDKVLYRNGEKVEQVFLSDTVNSDDKGRAWPVTEKIEKINGVEHSIYVTNDKPARDIAGVVVPAGHYFTMGDNRDDSYDSRGWGFVPEKNIVGKAVAVWFSWNGKNHSVRWDRIGNKIH